MSTQLWALAVAGAVVLAAAGLELVAVARARAHARLVSRRGLRRAIHPLLHRREVARSAERTRSPRFRSWSAFGSTRSMRVVERELADRFHVYTLPTTVVMSAQGRSLHVNYGYAPATKLERQLADARADLRAAASA